MPVFALIIAMLLIGDAMWWVWADRKARRTKHPRVWRPLIGLWSGLLLGYLIWFIVLPTQGRHAHVWMPIWALAVIYLWHLFVLPATVVFIFAGGFWQQLRGWWKRGDEHPGTTVGSVPSTFTLTRRQALSAALVAAPPLFTGGAVTVALHQLNRLRIRRIDVPFANLPAPLDGVRIAHVTDLHVGRFTRAEALPAIADTVNSLKADMVMFAGDLIDLAMVDLPAGIDFIRRLNPGSGLFMVEGNHDLFEDPDGFESQVRSAGLPLLLNESAFARVRGVDVQVLGMTWEHRDDDIAAAMSQLNPQRRSDCFQILLSHHPHAFDAAAAAGVPLTISGHTHGGQLMLTPNLGAGSVMFRYWSGLYRKNDSALVVSNGTGNWFPLRINAPAEIVEITLRRG